MDEWLGFMLVLFGKSAIQEGAQAIEIVARLQVRAKTLNSRSPRLGGNSGLTLGTIVCIATIKRPFSSLDADFNMLIPKADRKKIHEYLFREGVLVAKKDFNLPKHNEIDTKNLFVVKACQSLTSRGYLKTQFSWQWYYYTLTPEGLDYLREWLHLPAEIVPATHIKQQRSHAPPRGMMGGDDRAPRPGGRGRGDRGDREGGYRRRDAGEGKEGGAPGEFAPQFRGGFGRGRGAPPS
ncbi:MAG: hypothetical protein M1837_005515 [Sclerophora amabilis]|nr:MAG: hypothetical protein M1837_005515 [Sclerophora amabilis]